MNENIANSKIILFILGVLIALSPVFYFNQNLYGSPLSSGYSAGISVSGDSGTKLSLLFPFGFDLKLIAKNFYNYFLKANIIAFTDSSIPFRSCRRFIPVGMTKKVNLK